MLYYRGPEEKSINGRNTMIIHDIDKIFFDSESGWVREKCTECGVAKVFSSDGYAVCSCLEPVKVQRSILMDDTISFLSNFMQGNF